MVSVSDLIESIEKAVSNNDAQAVKTLSQELVAIVELAEQTEKFDAEKHEGLLESALQEFNDTDTNTHCEQIVADLRSGLLPQLHESVPKFLNLLKRKRKFGLMIKIAEIALQAGNSNPQVKRLYAQALIESKYLIVSIGFLRQLEAQCLAENQQLETSESRGLLGRAWKQIYVDAVSSGAPSSSNNVEVNKEALSNAICHYENEFNCNTDENLWHGINAVALMHRSERDNLGLENQKKYTILEKIIATIQKRTKTTTPASKETSDNGLDMWTQATAAEAYLAKGDMQEALKRVAGYVDTEKIQNERSDAFEIASTLRQFEEVWQLSDQVPEEKQILEVLRAALLEREGGLVSIDNPLSDLQTVDHMLSDSSFEKVLGEDRYKNLRWYKSGLERAGYVCRVEDKLGNGMGTGFLIHSETLGLAQYDEWLILTNAHVVSNAEYEQQSSPASLAPEDARIRFEASSLVERDIDFRVNDVIATSPRRELDFSVLTIADLSFTPELFPTTRHLPQVNKNQRIYIIGHPKGGGLSFSLHDNLLLDHEAPKVHYRSPTEGGSSGSPIFNQNWDLIGLHHAGSKTMKKLNGKSGEYPANEGIWIQSIISAIKTV